MVIFCASGLISDVRMRSSPREKALFFGVLLALVGLCGLAIPNLSAISRVVAGFCLAIGIVLYKGAFFVGAWNRSPVSRLRATPNGYFWLGILAAALWLGVVPLTFLWLYDHLHRH